MSKEKTIAQKVAEELGLTDQYVRAVVTNPLLRTSRTQKKVVESYCECMEERVAELRASILNEAINDFN